MLELLLQSGVDVPKTTAGQQLLAYVVPPLILLLGLILYRRSKVVGLEERNKRVREAVRAQRRKEDAAELKLPKDTVAAMSERGLWQRIDALFELEASETRTSLRAASRRVLGSVAVAWQDRVGWMPALARRAFALGLAVIVFGAVAVSADAVVSALQTPIGTPTSGSVWETVSGLGESGQDVVGTFPYAGTLWELLYAGGILAVTWLYKQWVLVAAGLIIASIAAVLLNRRVDEGAVPERLIQQPRMTAGRVAMSLFVIWVSGAGIAALGVVTSGLPTPYGIGLPAVAIGLGLLGLALAESTKRLRVVLTGNGSMALGASLAGDGWGALFGAFVAAEVAVVLAWVALPVAVRRMRTAIEDVAGADARAVAAFVLLRRWLAGLSAVAAVLVGAYLISGVFGGAWGRVLEAALTAPPVTQAIIGVTIVAVGGAFAFAVADSWSDIRDEFNAALAQQAVRTQVLTRGIPWLAVFVVSVLSWTLFQSLIAAVTLGLVAGVVVFKLSELVDEAAYRADFGEILKALFRSAPNYVTVLAQRVDVDGRECYLLQVHDETFLHEDREQVVDDAAAHGMALAERETPPGCDSRHIADYVLRYGIADREDWEDKLDEKIRKTALNSLRDTGVSVLGSNSRSMRRERFDRQFEEFDNDRVERRLRQADLARCLDRGSRYVTLERDHFESRDSGPEWPSLSD